MNYDEYKKVHLLRWEEIPDFALYMDQVVGLIEKSLGFLKFDEDDKLMTSTMINNYVKSGIVEAPVKKKYTKEHVAYFTVICLLKKVYSLDEISKLIKLQFDHSPTSQAYNSFCELFETLLQNKEYPYKQDDEVLDIFYRTVMSVVYCIYVQHEIHNFPTIAQTKKEEKKTKKK